MLNGKEQYPWLFISYGLNNKKTMYLAKVMFSSSLTFVLLKLGYF